MLTNINLNNNFINILWYQYLSKHQLMYTRKILTNNMCTYQKFVNQIHTTFSEFGLFFVSLDNNHIYNKSF